MNNREAFEAWYQNSYICFGQANFHLNSYGEYVDDDIEASWCAWQAALASQAQQDHIGDSNEMVQSQAQQESQALKALKGMIELWFRTRESGCLPIEVAHAQFVLKNILPPSPEGDKS